MSGTLGAGYFDPMTGMWVPQTNVTPAPAPTLAGIGNALGYANGGAYVPPGTPQNEWTGVSDAQMQGLYQPPRPPQQPPQAPQQAPQGGLYDQPPAPPQPPQQPSPAPSGAISPPAPPQPSPQAAANADAIQQGMQQGAQAAPSPWDVPDALQPLIASASKKYGVPENVLNAVYKQESDFGRASPNIGQVTQGTAANPGYGMNPLDPAKVNDPAANIDFTAQYLAKLGEKNGVKDWNDPKQLGSVLQGYNGGGDPNYVQNVSRYLQGSKPTQYAAAGNVQNDASGPAQPDAAQQQAATQPPGTMSPADYAKIMGQFQQQPSRQQQLLTLAAGLMGGPTLGAGLSKGIGDMNALTMAYQNHYQQAQTALANMGVRVQNNLTNQGIKQQNANTNSFRATNPAVKGPVVFQTDAQGNKVAGNVVYDPKTQASSFVPIQGGAGVTTTAQTNADNRVNVPLQGDLAAAKAVGAAGGKDNLKTADGFTGDVAAAGQQLQDIADARKVVQAEGVNGSTAKAKVVRAFASLSGLPIGDVSPDGVSLSEKLIQNLNNGAALAQGKGSFARMTQGEFQTLGKAAVNFNTNPGAALAMLDTMEQMAKRRLAIGQAYDALPDQAKQAMLKTPGGVNTFYRSQLGDQLAARGITSDPDQQTPSQYQKGPGGWQHTPTGGKKPRSAFDPSNGASHALRCQRRSSGGPHPPRDR